MVGAICALSAPAFANYTIEKGAKGEGKGVFTLGQDEFKCAKAVYAIKEAGEVKDLKARVKYEECPLEIGEPGLDPEVSEFQFNLNRGKEISKGQWEVGAELQNGPTIKISAFECTITYEAGQKRQFIWRNKKTAKELQSRFSVNITELDFESKGCAILGFANGKHKNSDLKEEVQMKGVKHN